MELRAFDREKLVSANVSEQVMATTSTADTIHMSGPTDVHSAEMSAALAQNWWAIALRGVLAIIFGLIALFVPAATILSLVLLFSAYMLVDSVFAIMAAVRAARQRE